MSVRISALIATLQELLKENGDLTIGIRHQFGRIKRITGVGSTEAITEDPSKPLKKGEKILWLTMLDMDEVRKVDNLDINEDRVEH